ncbi:putative sucrose-phosphatase 2 [Abeliophyllum distichum]|uniref:Sucrose-phosphatase n=1 Tax=Abeliophyllum distichum TaxID=126358 RepID=A0ABD1VBB2_9LAMI
MNRLSGAAHLMIVSDLDHTMVDHHDSENLSLLRFNALWESNYRHNSLWDHRVSEETSKFPELTLQSETEQRPHKVSFYIQKDKAQDVMKALSARLEERGLDVKIIYSGGMDLDILPQGAGKGQALAYLLKKLKAGGKLPNNTLACGDSGNDAELFSIPDVHGVMVRNAQEELLQWHAANVKDNPKIIHATERCAAGIIQAIGHFNLGPSASPRDVTDLTNSEMDKFDPSYEVVKFYLFYEGWRRAEVENSELYLANLKAVCCASGFFVHPSGIEQPLCDCVNSLRTCYGDKQGKQFRIWVDQVLPAQIDSHSWLVKFKKWEQSGEEQQCCMTTVVLSSKDVSVAEGLTWMHVHQTLLLDGSVQNNQQTWGPNSQIRKLPKRHISSNLEISTVNGSQNAIWTGFSDIFQHLLLLLVYNAAACILLQLMTDCPAAYLVLQLRPWLK